MNGHARDAAISLGVCAVTIAALIVTRDLHVLWLLALLLFVAF